MKRPFWVYAVLLVALTHIAIKDFTSLTRSTSSEKTQREPSLVRNATTEQMSHADPRWLRPADLPGYTGWSRPVQTWVNRFRLESLRTKGRVGENITTVVTCKGNANTNEDCTHALFYARAYGPAILPVYIENYQNGSYGFTIYPMDRGVYYLDVVLTFSHAPSLEDCPITKTPLYEGYMLPNFPVNIFIDDKDTRETTDSKIACTGADVVDRDTSSLPLQGRWKVDMLRHDHPEIKNVLTDYDTLGFRTDFVRSHCRLLSRQELLSLGKFQQVMKTSKFSDKPLHIIFIGDSNMNRVRAAFRGFFGDAASHIRTTSIRTNGGLVEAMANVTQELTALRQNDHHFFIVFNSGLHDVDMLCTSNTYNTERRRDLMNVTDNESFHCFDAYETLLRKFIDTIRAFPAHLHVYKGTLAAWLKYGVHTTAWKSNSQFPFPNSHELSLKANTIAFRLLKERGIPYMDGYWLSISRPDHRELTAGGSPGSKLLHTGPDIYDVLARQFATLFLETIGGLSIWSRSDLAQ